MADIPDINELVEAVRDVKNTNLFGVEKDTVIGEEKEFNPYKSPHKSTTQTNVFFGPIWIKEALGVETVENDSKTPIYHYASSHYGSVLPGKYLVRGNLYIYETKTSQLHATIAKYKQILEEERREDLVREIVGQRINLFQATIEGQLLARFGVEQAKAITAEALKSITSEVISGSEWRIPKLVIVSGDITDPEPIVDVYEDVDLNKDSKTILSDGATQIRSYGFIARRRPIRDKPQILIGPTKRKINLEDTIRDYVKRVLQKIRDNIKVSISQVPRAWPSHPNNIMYVGSLPDKMVSWGPKMCMTSFNIALHGVPDRIDEPVDVRTYRIDIDDEGAESINNSFKPISVPSTLRRGWKYFWPDIDVLMSGLATISKTIPTTPAYAFSWLAGLPGLDPTHPIIYDERESTAYTGSTLIQAFTGARFVTPTSGEGTIAGTSISSHHRLPIRDYAYVQTPIIKSESELISFIPVNAEIGRKSVSDRTSPEWFKPESGLQITGEYQYEKWFIFQPSGIGMRHFLSSITGGIFDVIGSFLPDDIFETLSLGLIGNTDDVDSYDLDLDDFPGYADQFTVFPGNLGGVSTQSIGIQVFPIAAKLFEGVDSTLEKALFTPVNALLSPIILAGNFTRELVAGTFGYDTDRSNALNYLSSSSTRCITDPNESPKYIWCFKNAIPGDDSIFSTEPTEPAKITFSVQWPKETIDTMLANKEMPYLIARVFSHTPEIPSTAEDEKMIELRDETTFVAASTHMPANKVEIGLDVRTDRSYLINKRTPLFEYLETALETNEEERLREEKFINYAITSQNLEVVDALQALAYLPTSAILGLTSLIGGVVLGAIDTATSILDTIESVPGVSQALDVVGAAGIDVKGFLQDSEIDDSAENGLGNIIVHAPSKAFIIVLSELSNMLSENIIEAINSPMVADKASVDDRRVFGNARFGQERGDTSLLRSLTHSILESELRNIFGEDGWNFIRASQKHINRYKMNFDTKTINTGTTRENAEVLIMLKRGTAPSPLIIDKALRESAEDIGVTEEQEEEITRGILF